MSISFFLFNIFMGMVINEIMNIIGKDIESETGGDFKKICVALSLPLATFEAESLHEAIAGVGTNEKTIIELLVGRSNSEMRILRETYQSMYRTTLESDLKSDLSGKFKRLVVALIQGNRDESGGVYDVNADVEGLYRGGEGKMGTDESVFISIFASRSENHLKAVFEAYAKRYNKSMEKVVKSEFSGDLEDGLLAIMRWVNNRFLYFAEQFEESMAGMGTNDAKLIRLTARLGRNPVYSTGIKNAFHQRFGKSLAKRVDGETSGDYKKMLLAVLAD